MTKAQEYISKAAEFYFSTVEAQVAREALLEIWEDFSQRMNDTDQEQLASNLFVALENMKQMDDEHQFFRCFHFDVKAASDVLESRLTGIQNQENE